MCFPFHVWLKGKSNCLWSGSSHNLIDTRNKEYTTFHVLFKGYSNCSWSGSWHDLIYIEIKEYNIPVKIHNEALLKKWYIIKNRAVCLEFVLKQRELTYNTHMYIIRIQIEKVEDKMDINVMKTCERANVNMEQ